MSFIPFQYQKPAEMTAQEVMVQQRLAYESLARAAQIRESPPPPHKTTPLSDKDPPPSDETGETRKGKRKLSLREMVRRGGVIMGEESN